MRGTGKLYSVYTCSKEKKIANIICVISEPYSKMWNALSTDIKLGRHVNAFKKMLKASLLENLKLRAVFNTEMYV